MEKERQELIRKIREFGETPVVLRLNERERLAITDLLMEAQQGNVAEVEAKFQHLLERISYP